MVNLTEYKLLKASVRHTHVKKEVFLVNGTGSFGISGFFKKFFVARNRVTFALCLAIATTPAQIIKDLVASGCAYAPTNCQKAPALCPI